VKLFYPCPGGDRNSIGLARVYRDSPRAAAGSDSLMVSIRAAGCRNLRSPIFPTCLASNVYIINGTEFAYIRVTRVEYRGNTITGQDFRELPESTIVIHYIGTLTISHMNK
jgi:hypothetical protein